MPERKPHWIKFKRAGGPLYKKVRTALDQNNLHTVCQEARCPNRGTCYSQGTATFLIMGSVCTRNCRYCAIEKGRPLPLDHDEPGHVASVVKELSLEHAVITSVTRDDLPGQGYLHFAETVSRIRKSSPSCTVEVLIPDFCNSMPEALDALTGAGVHIINHNMETARNIFPVMRPAGDFRHSLALLARAASHNVAVKSGLMVGLGETLDDIKATIQDIRNTGTHMLTIGQYLQADKNNEPVHRYYTPDEFEILKSYCLSLGFSSVASGPMVRSSYMARELYSQYKG